MTATTSQEKKERQEIDRVAIMFCGDSGDGMQLTGTQFTNTSAVFGNDVSTLPDFPAEIRAPAGSLPGVSGFQLNFSSHEIHTPGDRPQVLVAMNPAAFKVNLANLEPGGTLIANADAYNKGNLKKAGYDQNPLESPEIGKKYRVHAIPMTSMTMKALEDLGISHKDKERCKNFFALGLLYWLFSRSMDNTLAWIEEKFGKNKAVAEANRRALKAGWNYGETAEVFTVHYTVPQARLAPGRYRLITGNEAAALGFVTAARLAGKPLAYCSYPITPASDVLHHLSRLKQFDVRTLQCEDEIAAMGAAIGAAFGGAFALTGTSGPGVCLKSEAINLAIVLELPLVILNVQRGGPSTGLPTKTEQSDLLQALFGRNGESPIPILAPATPGDNFAIAIEAFRLAVRHMTPVFVLSDGYLANGAEPWRIPRLADLEKLEVRHRTDPAGFRPYERDPQTLARPWVLPGTPGLEHRLGGLEKADGTGNVSYDPANHEKMCRLRAEKVARIAFAIPPLAVDGPAKGKLLVLTWGGTYGAAVSAVSRFRKAGQPVSHAHLRYLNPFPNNLGEVLRGFERVLVPELNLGQLALLVRARYLVDAIPLNKVMGQPFTIAEIEKKIEELL